MSRRERLILMILGPLGLLLLFYYFVYSPNQAEYQRLRAELTQKEAQLQQMEQIAKQIPRLRAEFARLQGFVAELETKLPAEKEMPELLVQLERLTRSLVLNFDSIRPGPLEQPKPSGAGGTAQAGAPAYAVLRLPLSLNFRGTYDQVIRLAMALNDFPRMIAIREISLNPGQLPTLSWNVNAETYVLPRGK